MKELSDTEQKKDSSTQLIALIQESRPVNIIGGTYTQRQRLLDDTLDRLDPERYDVLRVDFRGAKKEEVVAKFREAGLQVPDSRLLTSSLRWSNAIEDKANEDGDKQLIVVAEELTDYDTLLVFRSIHNDNASRTGPNILVITSGEKHPTNYQPKGDPRAPYNIGHSVYLGKPAPEAQPTKRGGLFGIFRKK